MHLRHFGRFREAVSRSPCSIKKWFAKRRPPGPRPVAHGPFRVTPSAGQSLGSLIKALGSLIKDGPPQSPRSRPRLRRRQNNHRQPRVPARRSPPRRSRNRRQKKVIRGWARKFRAFWLGITCNNKAIETV